MGVVGDKTRDRRLVGQRERDIVTVPRVRRSRDSPPQHQRIPLRIARTVELHIGAAECDRHPGPYILGSGSIRNSVGELCYRRPVMILAPAADKDILDTDKLSDKLGL